ncbi:MAG: hypothetical protein JWO91_3965 [Acidobacteriaceae bacterium]|nr:hypothetical protein [Acidobacteriaceae bacterium]
MRQSAERRKVGRLIQEIKTLAHRTRDLPVPIELIEVDTKIHVSSIMSKAPWAPPTSIEFGEGLKVSKGQIIEKPSRPFCVCIPLTSSACARTSAIAFKRACKYRCQNCSCFAPRVMAFLNYSRTCLSRIRMAPHAVFESLDLITLPGGTRFFQVPQIIFSNT